MAQARGQFSPINEGESEVFGLDFTRDLPSGDSVITISDVTLTKAGGVGVDPSPDSRLDGPATLVNNVVSQRITDPVASVIYKLTIYVATAQGNVLDLWSYVTCVPK